MTLRNPNVLAIPEGIASNFPRFIPREHTLIGANGEQVATRTRIGMLLAGSEGESGLRLLRTCDTLVELARRYTARIPPQCSQKGLFRWHVSALPRAPPKL